MRVYKGGKNSLAVDCLEMSEIRHYIRFERTLNRLNKFLFLQQIKSLFPQAFHFNLLVLYYKRTQQPYITFSFSY